MSGLRWHDEAAREVFFRHGLATLQDLCEHELGEEVTHARTRRLRRLRLEGRGFYVKTQDLRRTRLPVRKWPSYAFRGSPVAREAAALAVLAARGFRTPEVLATGLERGLLLPRMAALVTGELEGWVDLARYLEAATPSAAAAAIAAADDLVRAVHAAGVILGGAKYRNILLPVAGVHHHDELALIDQPDLRVSRSPRLQARDWRLMRIDRARYGADT